MKKYLLSILAVTIAIASVAFTNKTPEKYTNPLWYYKLTTTSGENVRTNYEPLNGQDALCPGASSVRCVIEAPEFGDTDTPDLDNMNGVISQKP
jgi:hypothetical protein